MMADTKFLTSPQGRKLAYRHTATRSGKSFLWLSGFNSDMAGTKVTELEAWAVKAGHGFTAFDYSGHGQSDGDFEACTITDWHEDTLAVLDEVTEGELVLVGSSMGAWMALLAMKARTPRVGLHRPPDVAAPAVGGTLCHHPGGQVDDAVGLWRSDADHPRPDRKRCAAHRDGGADRL